MLWGLSSSSTHGLLWNAPNLGDQVSDKICKVNNLVYRITHTSALGCAILISLESAHVTLDTTLDWANSASMPKPWPKANYGLKWLSSMQKATKETQRLLQEIWPYRWKLWRVDIIDTNFMPPMCPMSECTCVDFKGQRLCDWLVFFLCRLCQKVFKNFDVGHFSVGNGIWNLSISIYITYFDLLESWSISMQNWVS